MKRELHMANFLHFTELSITARHLKRPSEYSGRCQITAREHGFQVRRVAATIMNK